MRAALEEARQYKDPKTEYMVVKDGKTIVIDKKIGLLIKQKVGILQKK